MSTLLLITALLQATDPAASAPVPQDVTPIIRTGPGVQAPAQPTGLSSAEVVRPPRIEPVPGRGAQGAVRVRLRDMVMVRGQEKNVVQGIGLVTGLAGTGDGAIAARRNLASLVQTQNINVPLGDVNSQNIAVVWVEATLEPGIKPGQAIDVRVSSLYDSESLVGGVLVHTELMDMTGRVVYATASGPITTGAFHAEGDGASVTRNHLTVGRVPMGGKVQRSVPSQLVSDHGYVYLDLRTLRGSFANATRISDAVNQLYPGMAVAQDAMTVAVRVPDDLPTTQHVPFLDSILQREVEPQSAARVVINERTGVIIMGEGIRITKGAITKGNLTVEIAETPEQSQPGPFSNGESETLPRTSLVLEEEDRALTIVNGAVSLQEVVEVLNVLGVTPRDMIQVLQDMAQSGMLHAEIIAQ